jgi:DNA-binding XRE family transcriptional regulator
MTPLEIVRRNNKLSQEDLGKKLGVSQTTIQRLEANKVWPSKKIVSGILTLFKNQITTDEILFPEKFKRK